MRRMMCVAAVAMAAVGTCMGYLTDFGGTPVNVEYSAGSGQNGAMMVVDFGASSYAFEYHWDGAANGFQMISAIADAGSLDMTSVYYDGVGNFVSTISYGGQTMGAAGWPTDWIGYFVSTDGQAWSDPGVGAEARTLAGGDWDGWALQTSSAWPPANTPTTPVPEPGTLALCAMGGAVLAWRRRRGQ